MRSSPPIDWARPAIKFDRESSPRERQADRFIGTALICSADMTAAMQELGMSARSFHRVLKLSRTIADLADSDQIQSPHLAEALQYRPRQQT